MLVNNVPFGEALASKFVDNSAPGSGKDLKPAHNVVLMRRHGYTTHGTDIETAVYRAIYTKINAGVQTSATNIQWAQHAGRPGHSFWPGLPACLPAWWVRPCITPSRLGNTLVVSFWVARIE
jgi:hypothetical protein